MYDLYGKSVMQRLNFKHKQAKTDPNKNTSEKRALSTKLMQEYKRNEEKNGNQREKVNWKKNKQPSAENQKKMNALDNEATNKLGLWGEEWT